MAYFLLNDVSIRDALLRDKVDLEDKTIELQEKTTKLNMLKKKKKSREQEADGLMQ